MSFTAMVESQSPSSAYLSRLNYGFSASKIDHACIVSAHITHVFHVELPRQGDVITRSEPNNTIRTCSALCKQLAPIVGATRDLTDTLHSSINQLIAKSYDLIPELEYKSTKRRNSRALFDAIGQAAAWLFGVGTQADNQNLQNEITKIRAIAATDAAASGRQKQEVLAFTKLANDRLDTMSKVLSTEHHTILTIEQEVSKLRISDEARLVAVQFLAKELSYYVSLHDSVARMELAIEALARGTLTTGLIPLDDMQTLMRNLSSELRSKQLGSLCYTSVIEAYRSKLFDFGRVDNDIYIRIRFPVSSWPKASVYKTNTHDMPISGKQGMITKLRDIPQLIVVTNQGGVGELAIEPRDGLIEDTMIIWHGFNSKSCIRMLLKDDGLRIKENCEFSVRKGDIQPSYTGLARGVYVVESMSNLYFSSINKSDLSACSTGTNLAHCSPCLVYLNCGCNLMQSSMIRHQADNPIVQNRCVGNLSENSVYHAVNLAVLNTFYEMTNISIDGKTLIHNKDKLSLDDNFKLPIFKDDNVEKYLAADESASYSLKKLARIMENETIIYH